MARGHHPGSRPGTGRACLSPPIDCHDGRIVAYTAGSGPNAELANRMLVKAVETLPEGAHPLVHSDRGCHCRWPGWLAIMDRYGLTRSTGVKGHSPDDDAAEGVPRTHEDGSVYPGHWEEHTRDEVLVLIDDCIRRHDHERIERSLGWDGFGTIPAEPGNGCMTISKKTSAASYPFGNVPIKTQKEVEECFLLSFLYRLQFYLQKVCRLLIAVELSIFLVLLC